MGEGVDDCRTEGIYLLMAVVMKGTIGNEDYALIVAFCLVASYHVGVVVGYAVASLDGCLASV